MGMGRPESGGAAHRLLWAVTGTAVLMGGAVMATAYGAAHGGDGEGGKAGPAASVTTPAPSLPPSPPLEEVMAEPAPASPTPEALPTTVDLAAALASVAAGADGGLSVAVRDAGSGASAVYGEDLFDTASIVKVDILAALLLRAQDADRALTALEKSRAATMIKNSDNAAALALWQSIGRAPGLEAANERLGLTGTQGGHDDYWGLTRTTAADQLALLDAVFSDDSALTATSRAYVADLMEHIAAGQDWGVSAAADDAPSGGGETALKNGWLPRTATGLWVINSIGRVDADGRTCLVAVLSDGNRTKEGGITTVESAARAAVAAVAEAGDSRVS
ncbi:class A beta-lactamase-related serine hydrolase [Streptomyces sp. FIT100]|uniref:class A beta-lactamase-related serine hydrolase n=1 Tax=Streptomyces sp. FIT100 TaxID=2837956 RepID=UPI0021CA9C57|nr:class A beta-lactamase-related serine hydrolase [Streptomyces sp. FIT100]